MAAKRKVYTEDFKREAVRLVTEQGYKISDAARNLDIHANMLRKWKRAMEANGHSPFPAQGHRSPDQEELHRLRQENKRLQMERAILKKALAFFASESS
jgi:transposase